MHAGLHRPAALADESVQRAERRTVWSRDDPHACLVAARDAESGLGKRGTKGTRAVARFPRLSDRDAHVWQGSSKSFGPRPLSAGHRRSRWLRRGLVPEPCRDVGTALSVQLSGHCGCPAACGQVVAEVALQRARRGFQPDVAAAIIKGTAVRTHVSDNDVVVRIDIPAMPLLARVFPDDEGVVLGPHGSEDAPHSLVALTIGQGRGRRQGQVMEGHGRSAAVAKGLHVVQRVGGGLDRRGNFHHARPLVLLGGQVREEMSTVSTGTSVPRRREDHRLDPRRAKTAPVSRDSSWRQPSSASAGTGRPRLAVLAIWLTLFPILPSSPRA